MQRKNKEIVNGNKGFVPTEAQGLARCGWRGRAGAPSSSLSSCNKLGRIGAWNVRSLYKPGKLANVLSEMKRMEVGIMGVSKTCWDKEGSFLTQLPESVGGDKYKVFFSGGEKKRKGVGLIVKEEVAKSILMCEPISDRIIIMRV